MNNTLTLKLELADEDRARIDRLATALENQIAWGQRNCKSCVETSLEVSRTNIGNQIPEPTVDALQEHLAATINKAAEFMGNKKPENKADDETSTDAQATTPPQEEKPAEAKFEPTRAMLATIVRELMTSGYKAQVKEIVKSYAPTVPGVPDDKVAECYSRLEGLKEGA